MLGAGTYVRRPVYAPALVAWIWRAAPLGRPDAGRRPGGQLGAAGAREVYVPTYRVSRAAQCELTHVTNITNITTIVNNPQQAVAVATSATASSRMR